MPDRWNGRRGGRVETPVSYRPVVLVSACVVPSAPLLLTALVPADDEVSALRDACVAAMRATIAARPDRIVAVGAVTAEVPAEQFGAMPRGVGTLPVGALIARWLTEAAEWSGPDVEFVAAGPEPVDVDHDAASTLAMIVLADLSSAANDASPLPVSEASVAMSKMIAEAVATADAPALAALDAGEAEALAIEGVPALGCLAAAAGAGEYDAFVEFRGAPFGVDYIVAVWRRRGRPER